MSSLPDGFHFERAITSIAIIGAGPSGIVQAKAALAQGFRNIKVFEMQSDLETGAPPCIPCASPFAIELLSRSRPLSPIYASLWANTPRDIMIFEGCEFPSGTPDFPFHTQVLEYLNGYAESIRHLIAFNKKIERVEKKDGKWVLYIRDMINLDAEMTIEKFDAVAVASGHYDVPYIPFYPGIDEFPASKITHSRYFRHPSKFQGKRVLLIGNGSSGTDLGNQLVNHASTVFRSIRSAAPIMLYTDPRVRDASPLKRFNTTTIELEDGTILENIDSVIFCTGYLYAVPMFSRKYGFVSETGEYIHHLFQQTFYTEDPSLVFLGMPRQILPFPTFQNQAILVAKVWDGKLCLPTVEEMRKDEMDRLEKKGFDGTKYHFYPFPEDVELAEGWRRWIEEDKSEGWEESMRPWRWTEERVKIRTNAVELKERFMKERSEGKWDHLDQS